MICFNLRVDWKFFKLVLKVYKFDGFGSVKIYDSLLIIVYEYFSNFFLYFIFSGEKVYLKCYFLLGYLN